LRGKVEGDKVEGDKVEGDKVEGDKVEGDRRKVPQHEDWISSTGVSRHFPV
jgi:hypothetical protein